VSLKLTTNRTTRKIFFIDIQTL